MSNNEAIFHQEVRDFIRIQAQRYGKIMGMLSDVTTQIAAIHTALDANATAAAAKVADLKTSVDATLADLTAAGAAGQSAVIDTIVTDLKDVLAKITTIESTDAMQLDAIKAEITTAIKAVPVPGVAPVAS